MSNTAIQAITELPDATKADVLKSVKAATDGIAFALQAATAKDKSRMLKGIGDAVGMLPGALGYAGIAFSIAASVFAVFGGGGDREDPVLVALNSLHSSFSREMRAIEATLSDVNAKVNGIIAGIDQVLSGISDIPAKVVAEMKLTDVTTMKDKFASVQRAAVHFAQGNLTREQMIAKCDDFEVASLFSELETILKDEKQLFSAKFGTMDRANGDVQLQLLVFYMSVVPLVTHCNALKYSVASIRADGDRMRDVLARVYARAAWYLAPPNRTIHVRERFSPFASAVDTVGFKLTLGWSLALSFQAYDFVPPHGACFEATGSGAYLTPRSLAPNSKVPRTSIFCVKSTLADDTPVRIVYAERGDDGARVSTLQPEVDGNFDRLDTRGWTENAVALYSPKVAHWTRLPRVQLVSDFVVLQAKTSKSSVDDITAECRALGAGYDRDGDAHSKEYKGAPLTIFCLKYQQRSLREIDEASGAFLVGVQFVDMEAGDAWKASCPEPGYVRDVRQITIPSKIKKAWLGGISTVRAYTVCLKWAPMTSASTANQFVQRVWLDDSAPMADKPKMKWNEGGRRMTLPAPPPSLELTQV